MAKVGAVTRRRWLGAAGGLGGVAGGVVMAACGAVGRGGDDAQPGGVGTDPVTLTVWHAAWAAPEVDARSRELFRIFEQAHPRIKVDWQGVDWAGSGPMLAKLAVASASDYMPDSFRSHWSIHGSVVHQGFVRALDAPMKQARLGRGDFTPSTWDLSSYRGQLYGVPSYAYAYAPWWSKDVFAASGLDPERPPNTFAEVLDASMRIHQAGPDGEITRIGWNHGMTAPGHFAVLFGGDVYDRQRDRVTPDHPAVVEALTWLLALTRRQGGFAPVAKFWEGRGGANPSHPFYIRQLGFLVVGADQYQHVQRFAPDLGYGVALYPGKSGAKANVENTTVQAEILPITRASKAPDQTWTFLKWLLVDQGAEWAWRSLATPCVLRVLDPFYEKLTANVLGKEAPLVRYLDVFKEVSRRGSRHWPTMPRTSEYLQSFTRAWNDVLQEKLSPEAAMQDLARTEQAELDRVLAGTR